VSDQDQFGEEDYWQLPEQFEESKKGDCEDFALWAWRQLLQMNYDARFALGTAGRYGDGHAWVTFAKDGKYFLLEPLSWPVGLTLPRLSILRYKPKFSIAWDGKKVSYYAHEDKKLDASMTQIGLLCGEWLVFWMAFWARLPLKILKRIAAKRVRV
jgi:hypothetical protein